MDAKKIIEVLDGYDRALDDNFGVTPVRHRGDDSPFLARPQLQHIKWMVGEARQFANEGRLDKAFRWLGFMQGVLWSVGVYTIDEMKKHNMPVETTG